MNAINKKGPTSWQQLEINLYLHYFYYPSRSPWLHNYELSYLAIHVLGLLTHP